LGSFQSPKLKKDVQPVGVGVKNQKKH